eukprot:TRINITY_DN3141_c0_g1_i2.p1 TRINITY_DN3141_c0_g1~~TRINITY_DN3141_c0_g1_i2.p1  ORF type:complete len:182 (-),score=23.80 TRINITY_DN3141_c0_g1_i2:65-610(-)
MFASNDNPGERRTSTRARGITKRIQKAIQEGRQEAKSTRLDTLENENYTQSVLETLDNDDGEYFENDEDEEQEFSFTSNKKRKKSKRLESVTVKKNPLKWNKNLNQLIEEERDRIEKGVPRNLGSPPYSTVAVGPSSIPARKFCSVCGYFGSYTCVICSARFCSISCQAAHKETRCLKFIV